MALLLLVLLTGTLLFLFYYEFFWKKLERKLGRSFLGLARDFVFQGQGVGMPVRGVSSKSGNPWQDWKYRTLVELHRKDRLYPKEAAKLAGVSVRDMEQYFDTLTAEGKAQSAGDAERGLFYKAAMGEAAGPPSPRTSGATAWQARGFE